MEVSRVSDRIKHLKHPRILEIKNIDEIEQQKGAFIVTLDLSEHDSKETIIRKISKGLSFPEYFGSNLDALEECILDLSWINDEKIVIFVNQFDKIENIENGYMARNIFEILIKFADEFDGRDGRKSGLVIFE